MAVFSEKQNCCGCGGCAQACPQNCIAMEPDEEGFLYPHIQQETCSQCGICDRVCPMRIKKHIDANPVETYAAYARDSSIRGQSSSGGAFSVVAQWVLENHGIVFGAAFTDDHAVWHISIENAADLGKLRGSKYVQSNIADTYREARAALELGKMVLFSGVACQIAGLYAFLKKDYDNLYTLDVLCHGAPSPRVWQAYRESQETAYKSQIKRVNFRDKLSGWNNFSMVITFENGEIYRKSFKEDAFMSFFLENICLRPSCHRCKFKEIPHVSDLTLGDAWGIGGSMPDMDDDQGTSLIIVNSEKGRHIFQQICPQLIFRPGQTDILLPPDADSRISVSPHPGRGKFFRAVASYAPMERLKQLLHRSIPQRAVAFGKRKVRKLCGWE